jgi:AraC family transcriptional regulator
MTAPTTHWQMPLQQPPAVSQMGVGRHGAAPVERWRLPGLWCVHFYQYAAELRINGESFAIRPGHVSITPPDAELEYRFRGPSVHTYAHLRLPAGDRAATVPIAVLQDLGRDFDALNDAFAQAVGWLPSRPQRAAARVWDILWQLTERTTRPTDAETIPAPVARVRELIELHLAEPLYVTELARRVGVSQNHLTRLFRAALGTTVVAYVRQRRVQRARHLLVNTTLPVKVIATEVGLPDLHLFNKTIRRVLGAAPRELRRRLRKPREGSTAHRSDTSHAHDHLRDR